ncbi:TonB-dependent receptor plug domain-containing protein [Ideonella sp. YS5]|uniref:TonB-dependent receptor plug domain-containing protein n=1 Tax=Ideonella sp. YS5 TaxID=3453714 RepID=UPI003EEF8DBD
MTVAAAAFTAAISHAAPDRSLAALSLEELSNIEITSVSKRTERLSDAPTSVYVITADDIRRSGATRLVEALRLAPNLHVAQMSAADYTVTARGFASSSANKLLVLIDGRSVYSPLFSGVFWDVQEVMLEDIERIEVISGPGSTLWGVNAVNGVINVITRDARASDGSLLSTQAGETGTRVAARHGRAHDDIAWRLYATRQDDKHSEIQSGEAKDDAGHLTQVGFRADGAREGARFTLQADVYRGRYGQPPPGTISTGVAFELGPITVSGAHMLGRWEQPLAQGGNLQLQAYVDHTQREVVPTFADRLTTVDLQLQHAIGGLGDHAPVWGLQVRRAWDHVDNSPYVAFLPARLVQDWASLFAQDELSLGESLHLTIGARAEHNDYTGTEFLPTLRLAWKWAPQQLLWAAATRTVRAPSRLDHDTFVPGEPPFLLRGGPGFQSEIARVFELGYRGQPAPGTSVSATLWHAEYERLRTQEIDFSVPYAYFANGMRGRTNGVELWGSAQLAPYWRMHAGYSRLWQDLRLEPGSVDVPGLAAAQGANPPDWWILRNAFDLPGAVELDLALRHTGALTAPDVPAYTTLDVRVGWRPRPGLDLALTGRNLLGGGHGEFTEVSTRTQVRRAWGIEAAWRF